MTLLGWTFRDESLAEEALTTPSYRMSSPGARDNQRLEFLGDAVLGLVAANLLYLRDKEANEGSLTSRRCHMVSAQTLAKAAESAGLAALLRRNKGAEPLQPGAKVLADAAEAVMGAAWLDGGFEAAKKVFDTLGLDAYSRFGELDGNPKSALQHYTQSMIPPLTPTYRTVSVGGTADKPVFLAEVSVEGLGAARGSGPTRKEAEARAADVLLASLCAG